MKTIKKLFALLLALTLCLSLGVCAFAVDGEDEEATEPVEATKISQFTKEYTVIGGTEDAAAPTGELEYTSFKVESTETPSKFSGDAKSLLFVGDIENWTARNYVASLSFDVDNGSVVAGNYYYTITEIAGSAQGVEYSKEAIYIVVQVTYSTNTTGERVLGYEIYTTDHTGDTDAVDGGTKTSTITNTYNLGSLTVSKTVTGNLGDYEDDFNVTVTFSTEDSLNVLTDITYTLPDGTEKTIEGGWTGTKSVTITLSHDETVTFNNIPAGVSYTVQEADYTQGSENTENGGYDAAVYALNDKTVTITDDEGNTVNASSASGSIEAEDADTVTITNNKGTEVRTGVSLDSLPYVLVLAAVLALGGVMIARKRRVEE